LQAWRKTNSPSWESGSLAPPAPSVVCVPMPKGGSFLNQDFDEQMFGAE